MIKVVHDTSPIFVKISEVPETKTRKAFIREFLKNKAYTSYNNLTCTVVQCRPGANRSVTEIHQLTLARFPKTTFEAILRIIKELIDEDAELRLTYCTTIKKVVVMYSKAREGYISHHAVSNLHVKGVDGYSLNDYQEVINNLN
jgi:hypothetical protein